MTTTHADYRLSQLDELEAESIHIFREVAAEFEKPVLMFSGGKDSIVMLRLAEKAFYPAKIPFPVLQVDTGFDFPEVLSTRDNWVDRLGGSAAAMYAVHRLSLDHDHVLKDLHERFEMVLDSLEREPD